MVSTAAPSRSRLLLLQETLRWPPQPKNSSRVGSQSWLFFRERVGKTVLNLFTKEDPEAEGKGPDGLSPSLPGSWNACTWGRGGGVNFVI